MRSPGKLVESMRLLHSVLIEFRVLAVGRSATGLLILLWAFWFWATARRASSAPTPPCSISPRLAPALPACPPPHMREGIPAARRAALDLWHHAMLQIAPPWRLGALAGYGRPRRRHGADRAGVRAANTLSYRARSAPTP
jgi:hypothetical protein